MRKVVEVVGSLAVGGAERVALEVAAGLGRRHPQQWRAELLVAGPIEEAATTSFEKSIKSEAEKRGVPVHHVNFASVKDREARRRLRDFLVENAVDLVHVHNRPQDWQVVALCRMIGVPVIYTVHLPYTYEKLQQKLLYAATGMAVPRVICVSKAVARQVRDEERVPIEKIRVIYNGIRMELFTPPTAEARAAKRRELGWGDDFIWFFAARLHEQKGHEFLLEAFARMPGTSRLMLAGEGPLEQPLKAQCTRLGLDGRVTFLGPRRDVPALLGAADGFACSSRQEGHPLSLLEAMACELPVVAPRLPSIEEIAMEGIPVFFGPSVTGWADKHDPQQLADALVSVEKDPGKARAAARAAREHVATQYSLDAMIDAHAAEYADVLDRPSGTPPIVRVAARRARSWAERFLV